MSETNQPKDESCLLSALRELAERRRMLGIAMMAFVKTFVYTPDWVYWQDYNKGNRN